MSDNIWFLCTLVSFLLLVFLRRCVFSVLEQVVSFSVQYFCLKFDLKAGLVVFFVPPPPPSRATGVGLRRALTTSSNRFASSHRSKQVCRVFSGVQFCMLSALVRIEASVIIVVFQLDIRFFFPPCNLSRNWSWICCRRKMVEDGGCRRYRSLLVSRSLMKLSPRIRIMMQFLWPGSAGIFLYWRCFACIWAGTTYLLWIWRSRGADMICRWFSRCFKP
jgi:hypothetical protein